MIQDNAFMRATKWKWSNDKMVEGVSRKYGLEIIKPKLEKLSRYIRIICSECEEDFRIQRNSTQTVCMECQHKRFARESARRRRWKGLEADKLQAIKSEERNAN